MKLTREILESMIHDVMEIRTKVELDSPRYTTTGGTLIEPGISQKGGSTPTVVEPGHQSAAGLPYKSMDMKAEEKEWLLFIKKYFKEYTTMTRLLYTIETLLYIEKHLGGGEKHRRGPSSLSESRQSDLVHIRSNALDKSLRAILDKKLGIKAAVGGNKVALNLVNEALTGLMIFYLYSNEAYKHKPAVSFDEFRRNVPKTFDKAIAERYAAATTGYVRDLLDSLTNAMDKYREENE